MRSREQNRYVDEVGQVLNATEMLNFVRSEAKRQYEECTEKLFSDLTIDEQQECILEQFEHQLTDRGWKVI